jgi:methionine-rich copper-binding protein CopC
MSDARTTLRTSSGTVKVLIVALAFAIASLPWAESWARSMSVVESYPMVNQIMEGKADAFSIRFDGPINHASSRLTLVTPQGSRPLHARLDSEPNTLFTAVGKLPPGSYELRWEARAMDGQVSKGTIPFKVGAK